MAEERKQQKKIFGALAIGAVIGAGIALLLAPKRGREFRAQLREGRISLKERIQEQRARSVGSRSAIKETRSLLSAKAKNSDYDAIVVGGGPNGLVIAAFLAKSGRKVLLLERKDAVGGIAVTEELIPGYRCSSLTDDSGYLAPQIIRDLDLGRHGLTFQTHDPLIFAPLPDGTNLTIWQDVERTAEEISKISAADASSYPVFIDQMSKFSQVISGLKFMTPPDLPDVGIRDLLEMRSIASPIRGLGRLDLTQVLRVLPMSVADLLNEWFESDLVKGVIAASALKNISFGPREAGTAYLMLSNWSPGDSGLFRSNRRAVGGSGAIGHSLAAAAAYNGAEIRTSSEVFKIITQDGQAVGIELDSGEQLSAAVIVSAVDMRTTFMKLVDPYYLDRTFVQHVNNIKYRGTMARVHFALNRLPSFTALNGDGEKLIGGHIQISLSMTYLQKAYDPVKYGRLSQQPFLDIHIPSLIDPSLAPAGQHLMSVTMKYMPYHWQEGDWNTASEMLGQLVVDTITEYAPDFSECIQDIRSITPLELETIYNLPEGNLSHGEMTLDQFMWMRPVPGYARYRAPISDLYLCSAATHPGGGLTGINGWNASREILQDWK